ncbi:ExbD/TolR family protein [Calidifontimicrobium sp. SYSU G02091]|uniref:ExbD/TolR family protein n=1 Tax=Calidifontimicrobium sp. SYSU G02091 TaxID=2926421 RepID=UPI001F5348D0|nr:ExbD/TolR family protein [Calidifontimicrobium sp. SYSU G02091]MCI1192915.1 ExbD/TolR family protein [Calidifontimicrobium sp. SYSU G02091]
MPQLAARGGRRRRTMNEINMVPFIDVMLVLLIIFMVSAPLITVGVVDLPSVGTAQQRAPKVVEIIVGADERLRLKVDGGNEESVALPQLVARVQQAQGGNGQVPVVISADRNVKYDAVVRVMDRLQRGGVQRVGLSVRQAG